MDARFAAGVVALTGGLILNGGPEVSQSRPPTDGPAQGPHQPGFSRDRIPIPQDERSSMRADVSPYRRAATAAAAPRAPLLPARWPARRRPAGGRRCAGTVLAALANRCSVSNGSKPSATRSRTPMHCLPDLAAFRRSPSTRKAISGPSSARMPGSRSCSSSIPSYKLILQVGPDVIGYQDKAHGMAVDAEDNVWIRRRTAPR